MHETAPAPVSSEQTSPSESAIPTSLPPPPAPIREPGWMARFVRVVVALPLAVLRRPLRSLGIAALLLLIGAGVSIAAAWLWASHHLRLGREAVERYHTAEAVPHLEAVLRMWPHDPEALLLAARAARRLGAPDQAQHLLDLYQEQHKEDDKLTLERVCLRAELGDPDSVLPYCRTLIEANDPATPLLYEALAKGYISSYQPYNALPLTRKWLEQEPDNPQAHLIQGQVLNLGEHKLDAIKSLRDALQVDSTLDEARQRLCDIFMDLGAFEDAAPHLDYLNARSPNDAKVLVYLARVQENRGHPEEAERIVDAVLAHQPNFAAALFERGKQALRARKTIEAEKWLGEAVKREPSNLQARTQLALAMEQNNKQAEADNEREQIKQMEQDIKDIRDILSGLMNKQQRSAELHYRLGMIVLRAGSTKEALRWLNNAIREEPNHQAAHKALMEHYQRIGDFGRAREHRHKLTDDTEKAPPP